MDAVSAAKRLLSVSQIALMRPAAFGAASGPGNRRRQCFGRGHNAKEALHMTSQGAAALVRGWAVVAMDRAQRQLHDIKYKVPTVALHECFVLGHRSIVQQTAILPVTVTAMLQAALPLPSRTAATTPATTRCRFALNTPRFTGRPTYPHIVQLFTHPSTFNGP
ncbi:hypothetical protein ACCO45_013560 [Purpureocillium lilacinum]|uniref:Uncharacterized protein n=1 Tax=Purpureocillium lilacinum TaxID=33203 RepID=A0ACC4D7B1_PURLI